MRIHCVNSLLLHDTTSLESREMNRYEVREKYMRIFKSIIALKWSPMDDVAFCVITPKISGRNGSGREQNFYVQ